MSKGDYKVPFIYAKDLKKKYSIEGRFYKLKEQRDLSFRSLLMIKKINPETDKKLSVVMLNPGGSIPLGLDFTEKTISYAEMSTLKNIALVPTRPDIAQYQIMRIMEELNFTEASVINLYDVRETKSNKVNKGTIDKRVSIFSKEREQELQSYISENTTVVIAWGKLGNGTKDFACDAYKAVEKLRANIFEVKQGDYFQYPSPPVQDLKRKWLDTIVYKLKENQ